MAQLFSIHALRGLFLSSLLLASPALAAPPGLYDKAVVEGLLPHRAVYAIKMVSRHSGAQVLNISGQMIFEWRSTCDAWTTDHRFKLNYEYTDSAPLQIKSDFSTYESADGQNFSFSSRRFRDGSLYEELRGGALRQGKDGAGTVSFTMPEETDTPLPAGSFFPMAHTIEVLEHIKKGSRFFNATVFDGSDNEGPVDINTVIGKHAPPVVATKTIDGTLIQSPAWSVRMAFFPRTENEEAESDYEMSVVFHENGVISDMLIDYDDFSVTQKLTALEPLPIPVCDSGKKPEKKGFSFGKPKK